MAEPLFPKCTNAAPPPRTKPVNVRFCLLMYNSHVERVFGTDRSAVLLRFSKVTTPNCEFGGSLESLADSNTRSHLRTKRFLLLHIYKHTPCKPDRWTRYSGTTVVQMRYSTSTPSTRTVLHVHIRFIYTRRKGSERLLWSLPP